MCEANGFYDPTLSSSYGSIQDPRFKINYGFEVDGAYLNDDVTLGGVTVDHITLAEATKVHHGSIYPHSGMSGVMGVMYEADESILHSKGQKYKGLLRHMVEQDIIGTRSYGVYMNHGQGGGVVLGGYDTSKYTGDLSVVPLLPSPDSPTGYFDYFRASLTSIAVTDAQGVKDSMSLNASVILATGTDISSVPKGVLEKLAAATNAKLEFTKAEDWDFEYEQYIVACDVAKKAGSVSFTFGHDDQAPAISVAYEHLVAPAINMLTGQPIFHADGSPICTLTFEAADTDSLLLGADFMQAAYLVYHLDEKTLGIAQVAPAADERLPTIVEIKPGDKMWQR